MAHNTYRPTLADFFCGGQKLSLKEAGEFDKKFHRHAEGKIIRVPTTGWTVICQDRHKRGISRKARISQKAI